MKLKNKKTGEIGELNYHDGFLQVVDTASPLCGNAVMGEYTTFSAINAEWEDYEEPKAYYIGRCGTIEEFDPTKDVGLTEMLKEIGNYFLSREEAEKAVEKLKAWKRLKNKGFRFKDYTRKFDGFKRVDGSVFITAELNDEGTIGMVDDLNICFGGEE